ncbi:lysozyme inhibitor LprI family protein [Jannaschia formosa]|uniref:lysozyme inhibitor LprI family protein n=1 Tax=Jannaschia formosa TaxID=2259592 RepID=UPI0014312CA2|nr:lysozyme inhibitor LprI family protein [Jannaschia formosa]
MKGLAALLALLAAPAAAQPVDCAAQDLAPPQLSYCAEVALETARAEMDEAYRLALTRAKAHDQRLAMEQGSVPLTLEIALRDAQAAFVEYRDRACEAEAIAHGGTGAPMAGVVCAARMTMARVEDLQRYGELE